MDYQEPICPFDVSAYTGTPDAEPTGQHMDVPQRIRELDAIIHAGKTEEALAFLHRSREEAAEMGDWRAELSMLSEMMGQYRYVNRPQQGLQAVQEGMALIREHHLGQTVSGATVMLNAATTLKHFGRAAEALPIFRHVSRIYADNLDPTDYRFGGLYNNMALACVDLEDAQGAEQYFRMALNVLAKGQHTENDMAVTWCNLAELYDRMDPLDERVGECVERAWDLLNMPELPQDGYHSISIEKCLPCFDYFGYFYYVKELRERVARIRGGA